MHVVPARSRVAAAALAAAVTAVALLGACAFKSSNEANSTIVVSATDSQCDVARTQTKAGTVKFNVKNEGSAVTEFYVYAVGDRIMGEVENIGPGLSRNFLVELPAGTYQTACKPGMKGNGIRGAFTVTGQAEPQKNADAKLKAATESYKHYVNSQTQALVQRTSELVAAVKAGDITKSKQLFPVSRVYYERIEPVVSSFGELDAAIDERESDPSLAGPEFTGYHRIEKALWQENTLAQMGPIADRLLRDVQELDRLAKNVDLTPLDLANGSKGLLDEIAVGKITGEEDRYSHTDLWDFDANVDGSKAAIASLRPVLEQKDPKLLATIDKRFDAVETELAKHERGDGYQLYTELSPAQVKELSTAVTALSEPVGQVAAVVARR
ncbi:MAG: peptidase M75 [Acidimicrobiales bacterium]|nr:MAG: peptidase M75 [Acidimicrobiales bacterium]